APYQRYPWAAMQRDGSPITEFEIQIGFTHFHLFGEYTRPPGVSVPASRGVDRTVGHFPITLYFSGSGHGPEQLELLLAANSSDITAVQVEALLSYYDRALAAIVRNPLASHHEAGLLSSVERQQLLLEWSDVAAPSRAEGCLYELLAAQADRTPAAVALVYGEEHLSYAELSARATVWSRRLRKRGVGPESLVAIFLERSADMVVVLWAALESGGAYLPLDPSQPPERLGLILEE